MAHHEHRTNPDTFRTTCCGNSCAIAWTAERTTQQAQWDNVDLPMWAVGNWSGMGLHLRGATEGYMRAASKHKKLRIHCGTHYHPFYSEDGRRDQLRFFDYWLKDIATAVIGRPAGEARHSHRSRRVSPR